MVDFLALFTLIDIIDGVKGFLEAGGIVLYFIMILALIMFSVIFERLFYYYIRFTKESKRWIQECRELSTELQGEQKKRITEMVISNAKRALKLNTNILHVCVALAPLFGLLGTVTGMIAVFEVMETFGNSNPKLMASGVSKAIIPTMVGMVISIIGLFFALQFKTKIKSLHTHFEERLYQGVTL
jgi:biopolymer transport protein ExbB